MKMKPSSPQVVPQEFLTIQWVLLTPTKRVAWSIPVFPQSLKVPFLYFIILSGTAKVTHTGLRITLLVRVSRVVEYDTKLPDILN